MNCLIIIEFDLSLNELFLLLLNLYSTRHMLASRVTLQYKVQIS